MPEVTVVTQGGKEVTLSENFVRRSPILMDMLEDCTSCTADKSIPMPAFRRESFSIVQSAITSTGGDDYAAAAELLDGDVTPDNTVLLEALKLTDFLGMEKERKHLVQTTGKRLAKISSEACKGRIPLSTALETIHVFFPPAGGRLNDR
jgi:hypothetical protein